MKILIFVSEKRFLKSYPELLKKDLIDIFALNNLLPTRNKHFKKEFNFYRNAFINFLVEKWHSTYCTFKKNKEVKTTLLRKYSCWDYLYLICGFFSFYLYDHIEKILIKCSKKIANKKLIEKIKAYKVIVLTPITSNEYLVYALAKKLNKKIFILPNGYDFARKMPIPLNADKYFTYDSISTKFYLKYKIPSLLIQKLRYPFYPSIKKIKNKKISTQQISRGRKNTVELYKKLVNATKHFSSSKKINFRSLVPKHEFLKCLELNEKKRFLKSYCLFGNNSNFNDEDGISFNFEEKNSNYYDFISRTSILILFSASHAVIEYSLANKPVLVVYESKKINFKKSIKEDFLYKDMFSNGLKFITFERLKKFKTEKELIEFASSFDINKIIYKDSFDLGSYLDSLIF